MEKNKWPKALSPLTEEQQFISDDFVKYWHEQLAKQKRYDAIEKFNHNYVVKHRPDKFLTTLEVGAGLGKHLEYENLTLEQKKNYVALELRENMAAAIHQRFPEVITHLGDCQVLLPFSDGHFDRIIAIHVLEHLPNLPAAVKEIHRLCKEKSGVFSVVIPCEGGVVYNLARKISAQRLFERRYKQPYKWFIKREHINEPDEILYEIQKYFYVAHRNFFPLQVPNININLCIGYTLKSKCK